MHRKVLNCRSWLHLHIILHFLWLSPLNALNKKQTQIPLEIVCNSSLIDRKSWCNESMVLNFWGNECMHKHSDKHSQMRIASMEYQLWLVNSFRYYIIFYVILYIPTNTYKRMPPRNLYTYMLRLKAEMRLHLSLAVTVG